MATSTYLDDDEELLPLSNLLVRSHAYGTLDSSPQSPVQLDPESGYAPENAGRLRNGAVEASDGTVPSKPPPFIELAEHLYTK